MSKYVCCPFILIPAVLACACAGNRVHRIPFSEKNDQIVYTGLNTSSDTEIRSLVLILYRDNSYHIEIEFAGGEENEIQGRGTYQLSDDNIILTSLDSLNYPHKYKIKDHMLVSVEQFELNLNVNDNTLFERSWKLINLEGKAITDSGERHPYAVFSILKSRVYGSGGCNRFNGYYQITGQQIKISRVISTKMACMEIDYEYDFFRTLEMSNEYIISGDSLFLRTNGIVKAVFVQSGLGLYSQSRE